MNNNIHIKRRNATAPNQLPADLHPILKRIYTGRNCLAAEELEQSLSRLLPPDQLKGIDEATILLEKVIHEEKRILIVADFDTDGATSCTLALRALWHLGAKDVRYIVPNRFEFGYGLTPEIVRVAIKNKPDLIITVDNGISSVDGVREAKNLGMSVLITDHHLPGSRLPDADAIVNPNQPGDEFSSKNLAGVGVIFYVMLALRARMRESGWFKHKNIPEPNLSKLLDLVALGTVADMVPLDANNRVLVAQGLKRINQRQACPGIRSLLQVAGRGNNHITAADLGYSVAPRLNAAGRLDDMSLGILCLLSGTTEEAKPLADQLDALNRTRRNIQDTMQQKANSLVDKLQLDETSLPKGLCVFDDSWHQGVVGLIASRLKETLHRPVIAFAPGNDQELKGSARSIDGLHIRDTLDAVAAHHPHLLKKFGGHAMAAGMTIKRVHYSAFADVFNEEVSRQLGDDDLQGTIMSDGELAVEDLRLELAELLKYAGPWGSSFPEPVFDGQFRIIERRVVGDNHLKLVLDFANRKKLDAIAFNQAPAGQMPDWSFIHAAYRVDVNEYQGSRSLQLVIEHMQPADGSVRID